MKVLAIDTACSACSVAVVRDGVVIGSRSEAMARGHAEALIPMVQDVMAGARVAFSDLDLIAVTIGPGSFTGLRTGLAAARGAGLAQGITVAGVTTLEAVAVAAAREAVESEAGLPIVVALETRRADLYIQRFDAALMPETDAVALPPEQARVYLPESGVLLAGDGAERLLDGAAAALCATVYVVGAARIPDIADVAAIAVARAGNPLPAHPLYIHPPAVRRPVSAPVSTPVSTPVSAPVVPGKEATP
jgi:tRNA threonylcarbamoyladenosine biosynthesis protein TsaB